MMNYDHEPYGFPVLTKTVCIECGNPSAHNSLRCQSHLDAAVYHSRLLREGYTIEERVMYISPNDTRNIMEYRGDGPWVDPGVDGAAAYPWLMMNYIAWVEIRYVKKTEWKQV